MQSLEKLQPLALLLLRCAVGIIFVSHGYPKLFGQTANTMQFFSKAGLPAEFAYLAGVLELFGGCLLIAGLFTRPVGLLLTAEMGVAIWKVHLGKGYMAVREYEFPLALAASAFVLATLGAGLISFDYPIFRGKRKTKSKNKA